MGIIVLASLLVVVLLASAVIAALVWVVKVQRQEMGDLIVQHAAERERLLEQTADERRELLTRVQHPGLIVTKQEQAPAPLPQEEDDYDLVGIVQSPSVDPEPGDEAKP